MDQLSNTIFTIPINALNRRQILDQIQAREGSKPFWIVTMNPEILLFAKKDAAYCATIQRADLRVADGIGIVAVLKLFGVAVPRVIGVDLADDIVKWASENHKKVCFIGGGDKHSATPALAEMKEKYENLIGFAENGGNVDTDGNGDEMNEEARMRIVMEKPNVVLVGFGHPKQERWIEKYLLDVPGIDVVMGVGGTFDYWSGLTPRAPKWLRSIGLEWLFRLVREPRRIKRILKAVFVFPFQVIFNRKTSN